ncbi:MAG: VOC family protein [Ignavibacteriae bacterium]|nr:VOC family protein [Ignavibacteriota bacterium]MCB9215303.1 VOC family protein [Ignavibacteria bacterium]
MERKQDIITWFEIPAHDFERAVLFYETILETKLHRFGSPGEDYAFFDHQNSVGGGITRHPGNVPSQSGVLVYLNGGDDLQPILDRVESAGGKVLSNKELISEEIGYSALFLDTEGNRLALHSRR